MGRVALGAFQTSPIPSLYAEAGEPSLEHRRLKLSKVYVVKIQSLPQNLRFDPITNPPPSELFEKSKTDPPVRTRILPHILEADTDPTLTDS